MTVRRRAVITTGTAGAALLGLSLSSPPGSRRFYLLTMGLAATWAGGALRSGPLPLRQARGRHNRRCHTLAAPVLTGAGAFGLFYGAARIARHVPPLDRAIGSILRYEHDGSTPLVLLSASANAVAEELFFRGALWDLVEDSHPVLITTAAYAVTTATTRNPALVLAGAATSVVFGTQRRTSGGILAPALSHLTWSLLMLRYLPSPLCTPGGPAREQPRAMRRRRAARGHAAGLGLFFIALGAAMIIVDTTVVNVAVPQIINDLGITSSDAQWVQEVYTPVFAALLPVWGRLADRYGRRLLFVAGTAAAAS